MMQKKKIIITVGVIVIVVSIIFFLVNSSDSGDQASAKQGKSDELVTVIRAGLPKTRRQSKISGTLVPRYDIAISNEGTSASITSVRAEAGDRVKKGQLLATLNASMFQAGLAQITAALMEAKANAQIARADYNRAMAVKDRGVFPLREIERRESVATAAEERLKYVKAQRREAKIRLSRTYIRALDNGLVLKRNAEIGHMAQNGRMLFRLAGGEGLIEFRGQVSEDDLSQMKHGQPVEVRMRQNPKTYVGKVRLVSPAVDDWSRLGTVWVTLSNDPALKVGSFAHAWIETGQVKMPVIPISALMADSFGKYVWVIDESNKVVRRSVDVLSIGNDQVVINSGITPNDRIVESAGAFLRADDTVKPHDIGIWTPKVETKKIESAKTDGSM